jgi:hypothetical protein
LLLLHQQQQCKIPLLVPLLGNLRHLGATSPARLLRLTTNRVGADTATTTPLCETVINIEDLQDSNPLSPPTPTLLGEGVQGGEDSHEHLQQQEQEAPIPLPHESELQVGLLAGIVAWGLPKQVEVSGSLLGGMLQLGTEIQVNDFIVHPLRTFFVALPASVLVLAWDMGLTPFRQACAWRLLLPRRPTSTTQLGPWLLDLCSRHCLLALILTFTSTGMVWIGAFSLMSQTFKPILIFKIKLVATLKLALLLATYIVYLLRPLVIKLWCWLRERRGRHDTPIMELPRLRREP